MKFSPTNKGFPNSSTSNETLSNTSFQEPGHTFEGHHQTSKIMTYDDSTESLLTMRKVCFF